MMKVLKRDFPGFPTKRESIPNKASLTNEARFHLTVTHAAPPLRSGP